MTSTETVRLETRPRPPRKLRMAHLFVVIFVIAALLAIGTQFGDGGAVFSILAGTALSGVAMAWWWRKAWLFLIPLGLLLLVVFVLPMEGVPQHEARRMQCSNNLKQLSLALHNYHDQHGSFPPAYVTDQHGTPLYSWRVLILPFIEQGNLYNDFHKDEPWDSPHNLTLVDQMSSVFSCPSSRQRGVMTTPYVAIVGQETMWPGAKSLSFGDIADGLSHTLMIVEWPESDIVWSEPRDLPMKEVDQWWHVPVEIRNGEHRHRHGVNAAFADGSIHLMQPHELSAPQLRSLLTPAGNDTVPGASPNMR